MPTNTCTYFGTQRLVRSVTLKQIVSIAPFEHRRPNKNLDLEGALVLKNAEGNTCKEREPTGYKRNFFYKKLPRVNRKQESRMEGREVMTYSCHLYYDSVA